MKRCFSWILSLMLISSVLLTAFVPNGHISKNQSSNLNNTDIYIYSLECPEQFVSFAENNVGYFIQSSEFATYSSCRLGMPFSFANTNSNIFYFPIYYKGSILCILRVYSDSIGNISGVLSKGFSDELNTISERTSSLNPLYIYENGNDIVFRINDYKWIIFSYPNNCEIEYADSTLTSNGIIVECTESNSSIINTPHLAMPLSRNTTMLDIFGPNNRPYEVQVGNSWCAAYCAAAIMRYKGISGLSAYDIMTDIYGYLPATSTALTNQQIYDYVTGEGFDIEMILSTLSFSSLCAEIDNDMPVFLMMRKGSPGAYTYHVITLCGYNNMSAMMTVWNPWYLFYETIYSVNNYVPANHSSLTYTYVGTIYNWTNE